MMKLALTIVAVCVALSGAATVQQEAGQRWGSHRRLSRENAVLQIHSLPHVVIPNSQDTKVAGYYTQAPYDVLSEFSYFSADEARQFIDYIKQHGYYPIINYTGGLVGFYSESTGATTKQSPQEANYYVQNLYYYGLSPIVNQKNQVVGFYYSSPSSAYSHSYNINNPGFYRGLPFYNSYYPQQYYPGYQQGYNYQTPSIYNYLY